MDKEGTTDLVVQLIMKNPSHTIFVESVSLGIALLEGGNTDIQASFYNQLTQEGNAEIFFKVKEHLLNFLHLKTQANHLQIHCL